MIVVVLGLLASFVPSLLLYLWLKKGNPDLDFQNRCRSFLIAGALCCFPVVLASFIFSLAELLLLGSRVPAIVKDLFHDFIVLAFAEELVKFLITRRNIKKGQGDVTWIDVMSFACIVGIGFGLAEDVVYAFTTNVIQIIVRGLTVGHGCYGILMGYFMGKSLQTKKKSDTILALLLPTFLHGLFDFSLSESLEALGDWTVFLPFIDLAVVMGIGIYLIVLIYKARKRNDPTYLTPMPFEL